MKTRNSHIPGTVVWSTFLFAASLWAGDSLLEYLWFNNNSESLFSTVLASGNSRILLFRLLFTGAVLTAGFAVSRILSRLAQSEAKARHDEQNLRTTVDSIGDGVIATDAHGVITGINPVASQLTGWPTEQALGRPLVEIFKIINAKTGEPVPNPLEMVLASGSEQGLANDTTLISKDGTGRQIADSAAPIRTLDGAITGAVLVFRDVTDEYAVRDQLRVSEARFRDVAISSWVWEVDANGRYVYSSEKVADILGYTVEEVLGRTPFDFMPPEEADRIGQVFAQVVQEKRSVVDLENVNIRKDGGRVCLLTNGVPILDNEGNYVGFRGADHDITERKRAEEANEKRLVALTRPLEDTAGVTFEDLFNIQDIQRLQDEFANATGVASIITNTDGTPITAPSNFCRLCIDIIRKTELGCANCYKSDAALGRYNPQGPIVQPCMSGGLWDAGAAISVGGKHIASWLIGQVRDETQTEDKMREYARRIQADEETVIEAFREVPAMSREQFGNVAQVLFTIASQLSDHAFQNVLQARFITERKEAVRELQRLRNYLANIIDSMPSVLIGVDPDGRVTQWNSQAQRSTGIAPTDAIGQPLATTYPRLATEMGRIREAMRNRRTISEAKQRSHAHGETRYEDITVFPLVANGIEGAVIRVDDVTEQVRLEEMMVQSEKMLSVGGLAAGMAHEINNPLAGMMQTASVVANRLTNIEMPANVEAAGQMGISMEAVREFMQAREIPSLLECICESGERAAKIVANMLSFARKSNHAFSSQSMVELIDQTVELAGSDYDLQRKHDFRRIEIIREYEEDLPEVCCESAKIQQVLLNILRNGAEAMQDETETNVPEKRPKFTIRVAHEKENAMLRVEIEDNGPGMDEITRRRIFEPFFTTKPTDRGTGLGLSVSYFIITENHKGEMYAESTRGEGSTFVIKLPLSRA